MAGVETILDLHINTKWVKTVFQLKYTHQMPPVLIIFI